MPARVPQNTLIETTGDPRPRLGLAVEEDEKEDWSSAEFFQERKRHYTIPTDFFGTKNQTLGGFFRVLLTKGIVVEKGKNVKSLFFAFIGKGEIWLVLIMDYSRASIFVETKRIESSIGAKIKRSKGRTR